MFMQCTQNMRFMSDKQCTHTEWICFAASPCQCRNLITQQASGWPMTQIHTQLAHFPTQFSVAHLFAHGMWRVQTLCLHMIHCTSTCVNDFILELFTNPHSTGTCFNDFKQELFTNFHSTGNSVNDFKQELFTNPHSTGACVNNFIQELFTSSHSTGTWSTYCPLLCLQRIKSSQRTARKEDNWYAWKWCAWLSIWAALWASRLPKLGYSGLFFSWVCLWLGAVCFVGVCGQGFCVRVQSGVLCVGTV